MVAQVRGEFRPGPHPYLSPCPRGRARYVPDHVPWRCWRSALLRWTCRARPSRAGRSSRPGSSRVPCAPSSQPGWHQCQRRGCCPCGADRESGSRADRGPAVRAVDLDHGDPARPHPAPAPCSASAPTSQPNYSPPPATTPTASDQKQHSPTSAARHPSPPVPDGCAATASTEEATAAPTRPAHHRPLPPALRPTHPRLPATTHHRRPQQTRDPPLPQAPHRPRRLHRPTRRLHHPHPLTSIGTWGWQGRLLSFVVESEPTPRTMVDRSAGSQCRLPTCRPAVPGSLNLFELRALPLTVSKVTVGPVREVTPSRIVEARAVDGVEDVAAFHPV